MFAVRRCLGWRVKFSKKHEEIGVNKHSQNGQNIYEAVE